MSFYVTVFMSFPPGEPSGYNVGVAMSSNDPLSSSYTALLTAMSQSDLTSHFPTITGFSSSPN